MISMFHVVLLKGFTLQYYIQGIILHYDFGDFQFYTIGASQSIGINVRFRVCIL